jgi:hypothetical protein
MLVHQLLSQPPAHANVTKVIYHGAKNIAGNRFIHSIRNVHLKHLLFLFTKQKSPIPRGFFIELCF